MELEPLDGYAVGVTAGRRAEEQARFLERRGARVVLGPVMRSESFEGDPALRAATEALIDRPPDAVVLTTGVGARGWFADADALGLGDALLAALLPSRVLVRGAKAAAAAVAAGLDVTWRAPEERAREIVEHLAADPRTSAARVAVQLHGDESPWLADAVRGLGADVVAVRSYRWALPDDVGPALRLVESITRREVDAVTFTSAPAVHHLVQLAERDGCREDLVEALATDVAPICVGPVSADAFGDYGLCPIQPERSRTASMVKALVDHFETRRRTVRLDGRNVTIQGGTVIVDGERIELPHRERHLLGALARHPGRVVGKAALREAAWPDGGGDDHAVEVTVNRLRRRLAASGPVVETVVRRGYRLAVDA